MICRSTLLSLCPICTSFLFIFSATKSHPPQSQYDSTSHNFSSTTILCLSASEFRFKFYWGFSTLSEQIYLFFFFNLNTILKCYFFCIIFVVYVFYLNVTLFYSFFLKQTCCMDLWFVHVRISFRFCKIIFVCKLLKHMLNYQLRIWKNHVATR